MQNVNQSLAKYNLSVGILYEDQISINYMYN